MEALWDNGCLEGLRLLEGDDHQAQGSESTLAQRVRAHFCGEVQDFRDVRLQFSEQSPFTDSVYRAARDIAPGCVVTYGDLAAKLGSPGSSRAVGSALGKNPTLLVVPCHRVVGAGKSSGGFSAPGGLRTKSLMLAAEGFGAESLWDEGEMEKGFLQLSEDPKLGEVVRAVGPCPLKAQFPNHPFGAIARAVLYQQLAGSAAAAIAKRVAALGSEPFPTPAEFAALSFEDLRGAGVSGPKIRTLHALANAVLAGEVRPEEFRLLPDDEVVRSISSVKGLGSWSAEMVLMFHLGRRDLLPVKDLGIRKGFQLVFGMKALPDAHRMERLAKPWRPYRSLASWYLWRSLEL